MLPKLDLPCCVNCWTAAGNFVDTATGVAPTTGIFISAPCGGNGLPLASVAVLGSRDVTTVVEADEEGIMREDDVVLPSNLTPLCVETREGFPDDNVETAAVDINVGELRWDCVFCKEIKMKNYFICILSPHFALLF